MACAPLVPLLSLLSTPLAAVPSHLSYVSIGSGLLLGDLDVIMGLQAAGFTISTAAFIDIDYGSGEQHPPGASHRREEERPCHHAIAAVASYLSPSEVVVFASAAEYALARLSGAQPSAHLFLQIDVTEVSFDEAAALSALALSDGGGGLGLRLCNQAGVAATVDAWVRVPTPAQSQSALDIDRLRKEVAHFATHQALGAEAAYARILERLEPRHLVRVELDDVVLGGGGGPAEARARKASSPVRYRASA